MFYEICHNEDLQALNPQIENSDEKPNGPIKSKQNTGILKNWGIYF